MQRRPILTLLGRASIAAACLLVWLLPAGSARASNDFWSETGAPVTAGVNTVDLTFSATPIADIVALALTPTNDGTAHAATGQRPTFSVFITASAPIAFAPGSSRIFVRFTDAVGQSHGATSVAVLAQ